jgi:hypothetical protein
LHASPFQSVRAPAIRYPARQSVHAQADLLVDEQPDVVRGDATRLSYLCFFVCLPILLLLRGDLPPSSFFRHSARRTCPRHRSSRPTHWVGSRATMVGDLPLSSFFDHHQRATPSTPPSGDLPPSSFFPQATDSARAPRGEGACPCHLSSAAS